MQNSSNSPKPSVNMAATFATPDMLNDSAWFPDSGVSNHVTNDNSNLASSSNYHGHEQVHMGDGTCVPIKHIGHSSFQSPFNPKISLQPKHFYMFLISLKILLVYLGLQKIILFILSFMLNRAMSNLRLPWKFSWRACLDLMAYIPSTILLSTHPHSIKFLVLLVLIFILIPLIACCTLN